MTCAPSRRRQRVVAPERRVPDRPDRRLRLGGRADAVALPRNAEKVAGGRVWCCHAQWRSRSSRARGERGYAGGAVPLDGGVVISLEATRSRALLRPTVVAHRASTQACAPAELRRIAREGGFALSPDPGAAEQSQIGGNVATNAGGPHCVQVRRHRRMGDRGSRSSCRREVVQLGGALRKDVAGYDLKHLLVGSEGTLGVITAAWLRLTPAPGGGMAGDRLASTACAAASERSNESSGSGCRPPRPSSTSYSGDDALRRRELPGEVWRRVSPVLAEADGSTEDAARIRADLLEVFAEDALALYVTRVAGGDRGALALARSVWRSSSTHSAV